MRSSIAVVLGLALAACGQGPDRGSPPTDSPPAVAAAYAGVNLDACMQLAQEQADAAEELCHGFIRDALAGAIAECARVGGELRPMAAPVIWALDLDADGAAEFLFDVTENFTCDGAPSVLSCGSLGCPSYVYARHGGAWSVLGAVDAQDVPGAEVLSAAGGGYGTLRGGCAGDRPCEEWTLYTWSGSAYERTGIEVRGHRVDVAPGGLWTLVRDAPVLAAPEADARVLDRYPAGTEVIVIGDARDARFRYVSPCNACQRGFVDTGALAKTKLP